MSKNNRFTLSRALLLATFCSLSACSGGNSSPDSTSTNDDPDILIVLPNDDSEGSTTGVTPVLIIPTPENPDSDEQVPDTRVSTRVNFYIEVPAYQSTSLRVQLVWGEKNISATWEVDESWTVSDDFPADTEHALIVSFYDGNGDIILGRYEQSFKTGTNESESHQITADQFNAGQWDDDGDGVSNIDELISGTDPLLDNTLNLNDPVSASIQLQPDKTFRISWQPVTGAQFYRVLENPDGISGYTPVGDDLDSSTVTFDHRVALYKRVNARYIVQACDARGCAESGEQTVHASFEPAIGYFKASNAEGQFGQTADNVGDRFGGAISLSADGQTLAIGAFREDSAATGANSNQNDNSASNSGAVYVFSRVQGTWEQQAYLKASNTGARDEFGRALSLSADGNTLAIGAPIEASAATGVNGNESDNNAFWSGAVYVFTRSGAEWRQQSYLKSSNTDVRDAFGTSVSLSADGNTLAIGAEFEASTAIGINGDESDNSGMNSGAVYVFIRTNGAWQQQAYLKDNNVEHDLVLFGEDVSLSADGNTLAVGAYGDDSAARGINGSPFNTSAIQSGAVYVFERNNGSWHQQAYLKASNTGPFDFFGTSISLSSDGNTLAVGASAEDSNATGINGNQANNSAERAGAVYVFVKLNQSWQQQAYIKASNAEADDYFGTTVSLSADGNTLAVGASGEKSDARGINGNQFDNSFEWAGAVYTFQRTHGNWQQQAYLKATNTRDESTESANARGITVTLSADGDTLAYGQIRESSGATGFNGNPFDRSAPGSGAVYLY